MPDDLTQPGSQGADPDVAWAVADVSHRAQGLALFRRYYDGDHRLQFATEKFRNAFGSLFQEFADNLCDDVVDEPCDRLQIIAWAGKAGARAAEMAEANHLDAVTGQVHLNGFREGDGYVIVWKDPDEIVRWYVQDPRQMAVQYDPDRPGKILKAARVWRVGKTWRCTIYTDTAIRRFTTRGTSPGGGIPQARSFVPYTETLVDDAGNAETYDAEGQNDTGRCPVFHYPMAGFGKYGTSVLADVIPLQDALNKTVLDMLVGMEFHALPQRWATGVVLEKDAQGNDVDPWEGGKNNVWTTGNDKANLGQFPAADLTAALDAQDSLRLEIARKGALPPYSVNTRSGGGALPSGIALLVAEGKTVKRVRNQQRDWGETHREAMAYALTLSGEPTDAKDLDLEWAPPETRDETALLEGLVIKKDLGVPTERLLIEAGYDDKDAKKWAGSAEEADAARQAALEAAMGGRTSPVEPSDGRALAGLQPAPEGPSGAPRPALAG